MVQRLFGNQEGYVTLTSVLIISVIGVVIMSSLTLLSVDAGFSAQGIDQAARARGLANSCAEIAIENIREDDTYTGASTEVIGVESCDFVVTDFVESSINKKEVVASATFGSATKEVRVVLSEFTSAIEIESWRSVF